QCKTLEPTSPLSPTSCSAFSLLASWIHTHSAHLGPEGAYCWAQARGIPTSHVALKTAKAICKICQIVPRRDQPTQIWQIDYVGPLPHDHRKANILTMVDTAIGSGEVWPASRADHWNTITK
uniref:Integrase n=1 Tax=Chrysemys picta bellii TaxID=8478 RepID=A0A8C3F7J9_CHRPI